MIKNIINKPAIAMRRRFKTNISSLILKTIVMGVDWHDLLHKYDDNDDDGFSGSVAHLSWRILTTITKPRSRHLPSDKNLIYIDPYIKYK